MLSHTHKNFGSIQFFISYNLRPYYEALVHFKKKPFVTRDVKMWRLIEWMCRSFAVAIFFIAFDLIVMQIWDGCLKAPSRIENIEKE